MKTYEIRRNLIQARKDAQSALEDYIQGIRNAPHTKLARALMRARAYNRLLFQPADEPANEHALKLLRDIENDEPYTRGI